MGVNGRSVKLSFTKGINEIDISKMTKGRGKLSYNVCTGLIQTHIPLRRRIGLM